MIRGHNTKFQVEFFTHTSYKISQKPHVVELGHMIGQSVWGMPIVTSPVGVKTD